MAKRSKSEDGDEHSAYESTGEASPPPPKKTKKATSVEDGADGAEARPKEKKAAAKKPKASKDSASGSKKGNIAKVSSTNADGEKFIDLGKKKRATVRSFKGAILIDIREFYGDDDDLKPGKKGISLSPEQWAELKSNANAIDDFIQKCK